MGSTRAKADHLADSNQRIVDRAVDFELKQSKRPAFDHSNAPIEITKQPDPTWKYGQGAPRQDVSKSHVEIDPYAADRPMIHNYRLLISGIAPRPVGFISTLSKDGSVKNLAPFSYFQVVDHDPPMFVVGISSREGSSKDTYCNLRDTGECVINTVSENMIEAVNATSIDAPYGISEWVISGLHEAPTTTVQAPRVQESVFSIEGKVVDIKELSHGQDGRSVAGLVLIKATNFWVREDSTNEEVSHIDLEKLRPIAQLGGMAYGRIGSTFEVPRRSWDDERPKSKVLTELENSKSEST